MTDVATVTGNGDGRHGHVRLTFDDGPSRSTPELLDALTTAGLRATMFNQGNHATDRPDQVRAQQAAGMWVGNHTFSHPYLTQVPAAAVFEEIDRTQQVLTAITGATPTLFRPPYGDTDDQIRAVATGLGLVEVLWTVGSRDWDGASAADIVAAAATVEPGGIILLHDWPPATIEAVPGIASMLRDRGLATGPLVR